MAITKTTAAAKKSKTAPVLTPKTAKTETEKKVEQFVLLHQTLTDLDAFNLLKSYEAYKKELQEIAIASSTDATEQVVFECEKGTVTFKAQTQTTVVTDKEGLFKTLGKDTFVAIAKLGITDLNTYLSKNELEPYTEKVAGSRALASVVVKDQG